MLKKTLLSIKYTSVISLTIAIMSFGYASFFFYSRSSLKIDCNANFVGYRSQEIVSSYMEINSYTDHMLEIPVPVSDLLTNVRSVHNFSSHSLACSTAWFYKHLLLALKNGNKPNFEKNTEKLEEIVLDISNDITIYGQTVIVNQVLNNKDIATTIQSLKKEMNSTEYAFFLYTLADSKLYHNNISVQNNGDVDLKNVQILVNSPINILTAEKKNVFEDILNANQLFSQNISINNQNDKIILFFPDFPIGMSFSILINTRQSPLNGQNITFKYEPSFNINVKKLFIYSVLLFFVLALLSCFKERMKDREVKTAKAITRSTHYQQIKHLSPIMRVRSILKK